MAALGAAAALRGPAPGGRVRLAFIGVGSQGRAQLTNVDPGYGDVRALCDINPAQLKLADGVLAKNGMPPARHYADWREMLQKEDVEAVIMAPPLWAHADLAVGCLDAGKHVLCEKMMAWDVESCERMRAAALGNDRVLEIGYQRNHNPMYQAAYDGIVKAGVLGDIFHVRLAWHRNGSWRRKAEKPSPDYDPSTVGLSDVRSPDQLAPVLEVLAGADGGAVQPPGQRRQLVPGGHTGRGDGFGRTLPVPGKPGSLRSRLCHLRVPRRPHRRFSSIESNAFDDYYEMYMGTKGTLIMLREREALLFEEGGSGRQTGIEVTPAGNGAAAQSSETMAANTNQGAARAAAPSATGDAAARPSATRLQMRRFCSAIRVGTPLACGPDKALGSARACIGANEAIKTKARVNLRTT